MEGESFSYINLTWQHFDLREFCFGAEKSSVGKQATFCSVFTGCPGERDGPGQPLSPQKVCFLRVLKVHQDVQQEA